MLGDVRTDLGGLQKCKVMNEQTEGDFRNVRGCTNRLRGPGATEMLGDERRD
jgi:hypothetical protein